MEICRNGKGIHHRKAGWLIPIWPGNEAKMGVDNPSMTLPFIMIINYHVPNYTQNDMLQIMQFPQCISEGFYHQVLDLGHLG